MSNDTVFVKILDKEYQVACPPDERMALTQAAQELDNRMRVIKGSGSVIGLERI
ncbi:MAG: cell division protein ZapA, partial [Pseudomonadota bacterium]|nr:cell division protein ZapA [Pseudomonadota bacterium]